MPAAAIEIDGQYRALREEAGFLERERGHLLVEGPDAADYLQGQVTNDVVALEPGQGCYAALLNAKGHMQGDMRVLRLGPHEVWIDTEPATAETIRRHLSLYKVGREVAVSDPGEGRAVVSVIGPRAGAAVGVDPPGPEHSHRRVELAGAGALAVTTDLGVDLICDPAGLGAIRGALERAGLPEVEPVAAEILRVESGRPRFGAEMTAATLPQEASINDRAVSFTKGCYIGQETVARLHYKGKPNRHLRGLRLGEPVAGGAPLRLGERDVGTVGTACVSPALGPIALAIVRREAGPGDVLTVGEDGVTAEVVELPFQR